MNDIQALNNLHTAPAGGASALDPKAVRVAKDFESVLLNKLMEAMQATVPESGLLEDGTSKQVQAIFWNYLSRDVADKGGMGLWKDIYRQLSPHDRLPAIADSMPDALPQMEVLK